MDLFPEVGNRWYILVCNGQDRLKLLIKYTVELGEANEIKLYHNDIKLNQSGSKN